MKRNTLAACAAAFLASASIAAPTQWTTGSGANGHWYEYFSDAITVADAFSQSSAATFNNMTGYLVTITSAEENTFAASIAGGQQFWIGASDAGNEGNFTWRSGPETGQAITFKGWGSGEPNNAGAGENDVHSNYCGTGCWNDIYAGYTNGYVVEFSGGVAAVPEPETYAMLVVGLLTIGAIAKRRTSRK